jgi:hypothetical protein
VMVVRQLAPNNISPSPSFPMKFSFFLFSTRWPLWLRFNRKLQVLAWDLTMQKWRGESFCSILQRIWFLLLNILAMFDQNRALEQPQNIL